MSAPRWATAFAAANAVALAAVLFAVYQPWTEVTTPVAEGLVRRWLPIALALAALGSLCVAAALDERERGWFLRRHFALYAAVPLALFVLRLAPQATGGQLGAIYVALAFAFAAHALHGIHRTLDRLMDGRAALLLGAIALATYLMVLPYHRAVQPTATDEPHYLLITQSLLYDGDLDLRNDYEGDRYAVFYPDRLPDMHGIEVGRAVYPIRDLGLPLLSALPFALAGRGGVLALMCLVGALLAAQCFLLLRDLHFAPRVAFLAVAAAAFTHPLLTYTTQIYPELPAALVFVTAARTLRHGAATRPRDLALASLLTGLLPALSTRAWLIALGLGLVVAYVALRQSADVATRARRVAAAALPFALVVLALAYADWRMFGLFLPSAGYFLIRDQQQVLTYATHVGAAGLFFDRVFGLVGRTPLYLLAFLGIAALARRARGGHGAETSALALGWGAYFLYVASIAYWWADGSPPSRYLVASAPFLVALVAGGIEAAGAAGRFRAAFAAGAWLCAAASAFVAYVFTVLPNLRYDLALEIRRTGSSGQLWEFLGRVFHPDPGALFPSLVSPDAVSLPLLVLVWSALALGLALAGWRSARSRGMAKP